MRILVIDDDLLRVGPHRHGGSLGPRARRKGITVAALALCGMTLTAGCVVSSPSSVGGGPSVGCLESLDGEEDRYAPVIDRVAMRYGVHPDLIDSVIRVESAFNPRAVSRKGARGLMQLMPETASLLGVRDAFDPLQNIDGGVRHLRGLLHRYRGKLVLALAAYNAGDGAVDRYRGVPPYRETQHYVKQVLWLYQDQVPRRHLRDRRPATASIPLILPAAHLAPGRQRVPGGTRSSC